MTVTATTSTSSSTSAATNAATTAKAVTVDYNSFLKLLVEQLKNQDPTKPTDPTQYLSELASFSNVEQTVQTNSKLDQMLTTSALTQAESVIGRTVTSADGKTTGIVSSVAIGTDGTPTATLTSGGTLALKNGITVSGS